MSRGSLPRSCEDEAREDEDDWLASVMGRCMVGKEKDPTPFCCWGRCARANARCTRARRQVDAPAHSQDDVSAHVWALWAFSLFSPTCFLLFVVVKSFPSLIAYEQILSIALRSCAWSLECLLRLLAFAGQRSVSWVC